MSHVYSPLSPIKLNSWVGGAVPGRKGTYATEMPSDKEQIGNANTGIHCNKNYGFPLILLGWQ